MVEIGIMLFGEFEQIDTGVIHYDFTPGEYHAGRAFFKPIVRGVSNYSA